MRETFSCSCHGENAEDLCEPAGAEAQRPMLEGRGAVCKNVLCISHTVPSSVAPSAAAAVRDSSCAAQFGFCSAKQVEEVLDVWRLILGRSGARAAGRSSSTDGNDSGQWVITRVETDGLRVSDASRFVLVMKTVSGIQTSDGNGGLTGATIRVCLEELGVGVGQRASEWDQGSVISAGAQQKKSEATVRKGSADTQEYEPCQLNNMGVDTDEICRTSFGLGAFGSGRLQNKRGELLGRKIEDC